MECSNINLILIIFFFQAEDGIRDFHVTGVQTCALPISALGDALRDALGGLGAGLYLGRTLASLNRTDTGLRALLSDGTELNCDLVLSAVGLRPRTALAGAAGLATGRGIRVDRQLRTSAAHVYALGDCAEVDGLNLLYVMPLMAGARALARTLAGEP